MEENRVTCLVALKFSLEENAEFFDLKILLQNV